MATSKYLALMITPFLLLPLIGSISAVGEQLETRGELGGFFSHQEIYASSRSLSGGMDTGDPDRDGDIEVAFCDFEGNVILLEQSDAGGFDPVVIWQVEGPQGSNRTLFDLIIHDLDPDLTGTEIITAGDAGSGSGKEVYLLHYDGSAWNSDVIYTSQFRIFDIEISDIDPAPGDEILLSSFKHEEDFAIHYLYRSGSTWLSKQIPTTEAPKATTVADADPNIPGKEVWACVAGWNLEGGVESHLVKCYKDQGIWQEEIIYTNPTELISNVKVGDLLSTHQGNEIIIAELSGWCRYLYHDGTEFQVEDIFQADTTSGSPSGLEGLAIGDFNPLHDGDEAMVTGYYNKVTQIIEFEGDLVADLAWEKDVENPRLEISGVEVGDVLENESGNEVLIASLQGWIELLVLQEDDIEMNAPLDEVQIDIGSSRNVYVEVIPVGYHSGPITVTVDPVTGLDIQIPSNLELKQQTILEVPIDIEVLPSFGDPREITLTVGAASGGYDASIDITLDVTTGGSTDVNLVIDPQIGTLYREGGSTHVSKLSLENADSYDYLEISSAEVEGLQIYANTPISPGQEQDITVSVDDMPATGAYTVSITASYNGLTVAQGSLLINIISMADGFETSVRKVKNEDNMYLATVEFDGPLDVDMVQVDIFIGDEKTFSDAMDFSSGENFTYPITISEDTEGGIRVELATLGGTSIKQSSITDAEYVKPGDDEADPILVYIAAVIVVILIIVMVLLIVFYKPSPDDQTDLQDIGAPTKYRAGKGPLGPKKVPITSRMDRSGRDVFDDIDRKDRVRRGEVRRAPPRPRSMGPPPRDVRRAPPRRR